MVTVLSGAMRMKAFITWSFPSAASAANAWSPNRKPSTNPAALALASLTKVRLPMVNEALAAGTERTSRISAEK
jgi:hypothetical protein